MQQKNISCLLHSLNSGDHDSLYQLLVPISKAISIFLLKMSCSIINYSSKSNGKVTVNYINDPDHNLICGYNFIYYM